MDYWVKHSTFTQETRVTVLPEAKTVTYVIFKVFFNIILQFSIPVWLPKAANLLALG